MSCMIVLHIVFVTQQSKSSCTASVYGTDHFIFRGGVGAGIFLNEIVFFAPTGAKKNVFDKVKNKKFVLHSVRVLEALFPGNYKGVQITQNLQCMKHVDLLLQAVY